MRILILIFIFVIGAVVGTKFYSEIPWVKYLIYLFGGVIWFSLTYSWWAIKLLKI